MIQHEVDDIKLAAEAIAQQVEQLPKVAIILGSGLGPVAESVVDPVVIPYSDIPGFSTSSAPSHKGRMCIGDLYGVKVMLMQGRTHLYEGYSPQAITFPIRVMKALGIEKLLVTNAAGGINQSFQVGDLMLIEDHINMVGMAGMDPTRGSNDSELGPRFTSLNKAYDPEFIRTVEQGCVRCSVILRRGVYAYLVGPCFETPAEIRFLSMIGADAVGMSTVPEVMVARNAGIRVLAVSAITNMAIHDTESAEETTEEEVWENVEGILPNMSVLIETFLGEC